MSERVAQHSSEKVTMPLKSKSSVAVLSGALSVGGVASNFCFPVPLKSA